ncbi:MAG: hypothetical protein LBR34_00810 [Prevotella sp.]|jgi:hypothetical protein|nr:hypothetical protein [Prevotella sp.]
MKKVILSAIMSFVMLAAMPLMAQDAKKAECDKAKTEKACCKAKAADEKKACCKATDEKKAEKKACCSKDKKAADATAETK